MAGWPLALPLTLFAGSLVWAIGVAWLLRRAVRQFRLYTTVAPRRDLDLALAPTIAVIVPARDEAATIGRCLAALIGQDYPAERLAICVVDDNSRDATARIVAAIATGAANVTLLAGRRLPPGWAGKPYACWQGALDARAELLCFVDADTCAEPGLLRSAVAAARQYRADMISLEPFQELVGFWDRLIIPVGLFAIACTGDITRAADPDCREAQVNGQFLLVRRSVYFAVGGHAAVRGEICEDSALARRLKQAGFSLRLFGGERLIRTRMYADLPSLWQGLVKNAADTFGGPVRTTAAVLGCLAVGWATPALPILAAVAFHARPGSVDLAALVLAACASLTVLAAELAAMRYFRIPWWYAILFPLASTAAASLGLASVLAHARGCVVWKGRIYAVPR